MRYMGSKARIAKYILPIILKDRKPGQYYVEPFCGGCNPFRGFPSQPPPVCCGNDVFPHGLDGITFLAWRRQSIKAYGNAIVPQVFYQIEKTINEYERL